MRLTFTGPDDVLRTLSALGRTEDVSWSPNGRRLALAGLAADKLLILGVECSTGASQKSVYLSDAMEVVSSSLERPHGVFWISDSILSVASREGHVALFDIPKADQTVSAFRLPPVATVSELDTPLLKSPGSLYARPLGAGLLELWVCNGFAHHVSHHLLDARSEFAHLDAQVLMGRGLEIPDGVALDSSGAWIAISNHERHTVSLYRNDPDLRSGSGPAAELHGIHYPHGLCFVAGGRVLLVADAGAPHIAWFCRGSEGWPPIVSKPDGFVQVLADPVFRKGQHNPQEGGPKGLDVHEPRAILVTTCEEQPLAFFDLDAILPPDVRVSEGPGEGPLEGMRAAVLRLARDAAERDENLMAPLRGELAHMRASWSWRVTAPLRAVGGMCLRWASGMRRH